MGRYLGDINARARGLRTHLLPPSDLGRLAHAPSLAALQAELSALGFIDTDSPATPASLGKAIRRHAASELRVLERWCSGDRRAVLAVIFEDEDRRSIQAIMRGAEQNATSEARLEGLVPTSSLSERALAALASQPTPADVVRLLVLWGHPFGRPLVDAARRPHPSLFELEGALQREFAQRALALADEGGPQLREYVQQLVDLMNAWSALLHFTERDPAIVDLTFVEGGRWLSRGAFEELMELDTGRDVKKRLAREFHNSALESVFRQEADELSELDTLALQAQIKWQQRALRLDPSGAAPTIGFAIELRAQVVNLRRIIWGVALRAPSALIEAEMVIR